MKKYLGYYCTLDGGQTHNREGYEFSSLAEAKKEMRKIAYGNDIGSGARWWIMQEGDDCSPIAEGRVK